MANRAQKVADADSTQDFDDTTLGKEDLESRAPDKFGYVNTAYRNGKMNPNRVPEAEEVVAKKMGMPFNQNPVEKFFQRANTRLVDPELSLGEAGTFGQKDKWWPGEYDDRPEPIIWQDEAPATPSKTVSSRTAGKAGKPSGAPDITNMMADLASRTVVIGKDFLKKPGQKPKALPEAPVQNSVFGQKPTISSMRGQVQPPMRSRLPFK